MSVFIANTIRNVAASLGIPSAIPLAVATAESGLTNPAPYWDVNGLAEGPFSTHAGFGGYTFHQLANPTTNITAAISQMKLPYEQGLAQGLQGTALLDYVANNSGFPDAAGVAFANTYEPGYDMKLNRIYAGIEKQGGASSPSTQGIAKSGSDAWIKWADSMDSKLAMNFSITAPMKSITNDATAIVMRFSFFIIAIICFILALQGLGWFGSSSEAPAAEEALIV